MLRATSDGLKLKNAAATTPAETAPIGAERPAKYGIRPPRKPTAVRCCSVSGAK
jgi:hypothetical protein